MNVSEWVVDSLLVVLNVVLWLSVLALGVLVYGLTRQVRVLANRIAPAGALAVNQGLVPGGEAPRLTLTSLGDEEVTIGAPDPASSGQLLFFVAPDCPICQSLIPVARSIAEAEEALQLIFASDGDDRDSHGAYVARHGLEAWPYILSEDLGRTYGVSKLPYAVLVDAAGSVASFGIVNTREHLESLFEARKLNVTSLQAYLEQQEESTGDQDMFVDAGSHTGDRHAAE